MKKIIVILFSLFSLGTYAQDLGILHCTENPEINRFFSEELEGRYRQTQQYIQAQENQKAYSNALNLIELAQIANLPAYLAEANNLTGIASFYLGKYTDAFTYFLKTSIIYEESGNEYGVVRSYNNVATLLEIMGDQEQALVYFQRIWELIQDDQTNSLHATVLFNMSNTYVDLGEYRNALVYGYRALDIARAERDTSTQMGVLYNMADAEQRFGGLHTALSYLDSAQVLLNAYYNHREYVRIHRMYGTVYNKLGRTALAWYHLEKSLLAIQGRPNDDDMRRLSPELSVYYESVGNFKQALHYDSLYLELQKSEVYDNLDELAESIYTEFEIRRARRESMELEKEKAQQQQIIEVRRRVNVAMSLLILVFSLSLIFGIYEIRKRKKEAGILKEQNDLLQEANENLQETEDRLQKENEILNTYLSVIAHDLINPFQSLLGFTRMLKEEMNELKPEEISSFTHTIHASAINLNNLLINLMEWSQLHSGDFTPKPETVRIPDLVAEITGLYQLSLLQKELELKQNLNPNITVYCDPKAIHTILRNLVSNAIKFSYPGSVIQVKAETSDEVTVLCVSDQGKGISEEVRDKLFTGDAFQSDPGTKNETGTGLGLLICKDLAEVNQGKLWFENQKEGGTAFFIALPSGRRKDA